MLLKETFRYQNYLKSLIDNALDYINAKSNVTTTTQLHKRSASNPNATDETTVVTFDRDYDWSVEDIISFISFVIKEKEVLSYEIAKTKSNADDNIDSMLSTNKLAKYIIFSIKNGNNRFKENTKITTGKGFLINVNGDQVPYYYDIEETTKLNFDKKVVDDFVKNLKIKSDENSIEVEKLNVTLDVNFSPFFNMSDTFEECVNSFINR